MCLPASKLCRWVGSRLSQEAWLQGGSGQKIPEASSPHTVCWGHHTAAGHPPPQPPGLWAHPSRPHSLGGANPPGCCSGWDKPDATARRSGLHPQKLSTRHCAALEALRECPCRPQSLVEKEVGDIRVTTGSGRPSWSGFVYPHPCYKFSSGSGSSLLRAGWWPPPLRVPFQPRPLSPTALIAISLQVGPCSGLRCVA